MCLPFRLSLQYHFHSVILAEMETDQTFTASFVQIQKPFLALVGALIMVNVMLMGE